MSARTDALLRLYADELAKLLTEARRDGEEAPRVRGFPLVGVITLLGALILALLLGACASSAGRAGSAVRPACVKADVVGCGGPLDDIYREIYTPGRGTDLGA